MEELLHYALEVRAVRKKSRTPKSQKHRRLENKKRRAETKRLRSRPARVGDRRRRLSAQCGDGHLRYTEPMKSYEDVRTGTHDT